MLDKDGWTTAHAKLKKEKRKHINEKQINAIKPNKALAAHKADSRCHIWLQYSNQFNIFGSLMQIT